MKKNELLSFIERAIETEDKVAEQMADNVSSALQWYDVNEAERKRIKTMLSTIASDSRQHSQTLAELKLRIENDAKEDY